MGCTCNIGIGIDIGYHNACAVDVDIGGAAAVVHIDSTAIFNSSMVCGSKA